MVVVSGLIGVQLMDMVGEGYDQKVNMWKKEAEDPILSVKQVSNSNFGSTEPCGSCIRLNWCAPEAWSSAPN